MNRLAPILITLAVSLACDTKTDDADANSTESGSDATDSDATSSDDSTGSEDSTGSDTGESVMCPDVFPAVDDSCTMDSDCVLALHTISCCGTNVAWGIAASGVAAFEANEAVCDGQYPECDCAPLPTLAQDGNSVEDPLLLAVACQMGACWSYALFP